MNNLRFLSFKSGKLRHLKGARRVLETTPARLYRLFISHPSRCFKSNCAHYESPPPGAIAGDAAARSVCVSAVARRFIGAKGCETSVSRRPGQVCECSRRGSPLSRGATVSLMAVNNAARLPCSVRGPSLEMRSGGVYIQRAA